VKHRVDSQPSSTRYLHAKGNVMVKDPVHLEWYQVSASRMRSVLSFLSTTRAQQLDTASTYFFFFSRLYRPQCFIKSFIAGEPLHSSQVPVPFEPANKSARYPESCPRAKEVKTSDVVKCRECSAYSPVVKSSVLANAERTWCA
jgi:hypothetical protein